MQRAAYEGGKKGKSWAATFGDLVLDNRSDRRLFTLGLIKCIQDKWQDGEDGKPYEVHVHDGQAGSVSMAVAV